MPARSQQVLQLANVSQPSGNALRLAEPRNLEQSNFGWTIVDFSRLGRHFDEFAIRCRGGTLREAGFHRAKRSKLAAIEKCHQSVHSTRRSDGLLVARINNSGVVGFASVSSLLGQVLRRSIRKGPSSPQQLAEWRYCAYGR